MKNLSFLIVSIMLAAAGCGDSGGIITMTTSAEWVSFQLKGSGTAIVDWGDGSEKQTVDLDLVNEYGWVWIKRTNLEPPPRTITITGKNITGLNCSRTEIDVSKNPVDINQFTELDVSRNPALTELRCGENRLTALNVRKNPALTKLNCEQNRLTALDVSKNPALTDLWCQRNQLTALDVRKNPALTVLFCGENQLTALDVSRNPVLRNLLCDENQLTALDVRQNPALIELWLQNNRLTALDVSRNTALVRLWLQNNQLTADALNGLFGTLHDKIIVYEGKQVLLIMDVSSNPGYAACDQSIFDAKGWKTGF